MTSECRLIDAVRHGTATPPVDTGGRGAGSVRSAGVVGADRLLDICPLPGHMPP